MPETKEKLISGEKFTISMPYTEGHVCSAAEAKALNQVRAENIGNNKREAVNKAKESGNLDEVRAEIAKYDSDYIFTMASVGVTRRVVDPVEREARVVAKLLLKEHLAKTGRKLTLPKEATEDQKAQWAETIESKIDELATREDVLKAARKRVKERQTLSDSIRLDDEVAETAEAA